MLLSESHSDQIADKYNVMSEVDKSRALEDKRDIATIKREDFLKIVKDDRRVGEAENDEDAPNIDRDGVKFKVDDLESGLKLKTSQQADRKPLITEISSGPVPTQSKQLVQEIIEVPFSWTDA